MVHNEFALRIISIDKSNGLFDMPDEDTKDLEAQKISSDSMVLVFAKKITVEKMGNRIIMIKVIIYIMAMSEIEANE